MIRRIALALIGSLVALTPNAHAGPNAQVDGAYSARPSNAAPQDKAHTFFILHLAGGGTARQSVVIQNLSKRTKRLLLDPVDGLTSTTSGAVYANRQDPRSSAGSWLVLKHGQVIVGPGKTVRVPFDVAVPNGTAPGDHLAGVAIQDTHVTTSKGRLSVTEIVRVVVGVQIVVDGPTRKHLELGAIAIKPLPGTKVPSVTIHLSNTGTLMCKPRLDASLRGESGEEQSVSRRLDTLLPATSIDFPLPWTHALAAGTYDVSIQASGCGKRARTQATAELSSDLQGTPDQPDPTPPVVIVKHDTPWLWIGLGLLAAVILTSAFMLLLLRRRDR